MGLDVTTAAPAASNVRIPAPVEVPRPAPDPVPAAAPRKQRSRWAPAIAIGIALAVLVALIVVLLVNSDFGDGGNAAPSRNVPNVNGIAYGQAEAALKALGFTVARTDVNEPETAPDVVTGQDPEGGRKIPKGGLITLKVSSATIPMPNVVGQQRTQATQALAATNLTGNFVEQDSDQPPGTVLSSDPAAGAPVAKLPQGGRPTVQVIVAREPAIPVPDVSSLDPGRRPRHAHPGRVPAHHRQRRERRRTGGGVVGTDPAAGTPLPRGSAVTLQMSSGPTQVPVASVVGSAPRHRRGRAQRHPRVRGAGQLRQRRPHQEGDRRVADARGRRGHQGIDRRHRRRSLTLVSWYADHGRHDLPWRRTRDRWAILVSEVMLHQTQVARVAAVYDDFLARFPTPAAMADAGAGRGDHGVGPARVPAAGATPLRHRGRAARPRLARRPE